MTSALLRFQFKAFVLTLVASVSSLVLGQDSDVEKETPFVVSYTSNYLPTDSKINCVEATPVAKIKENFAKPGVDYASSPLWVWNDLLTEEQIRSTMGDLNAQHVNQVFVHPRPGLATPYLSDDWFKLWNAALDEARSRGMKVWIYDENSYPSGFAGGFVPDVMPESRGAGLDVVSYDSLVDSEGRWQAGEATLYVIEELNDGSSVDRTSEVLTAKEAGQKIPEKSKDGRRWIVGRTQLAGTSQWFGGKTYVNLLTKGVLEKFISFTHESYRQHFGSEFGKLIPGAFTDEPQIASAGMFSWTYDFPEEFQKRNGYDLIPHIASLIEPVGDWKKIRYDYFKTVLDVFIERWHKPLAEYCESVGLQYTGHDWEHEWPNAHHCPDNMATAFWRQRPAIDLLMNNFSRGTHSQFGNVRSVRELNSATRQSGRCRSISENYGAGGYDIKFEDLKRLGDWSYALGVNTTDEHLSYISIRGARKHDHPQTFSYHSSWFEQYSKLEDYWTRLSYILSRGTLTNERFLLLEPTSTVWLYQNAAGKENDGKKDRIGNEFAELLNKMEALQLDYDLGSEDIIRRVGSVQNGYFIVGAASYETVVLPPNCENIDSKTLSLLAEFIQQGGNVVVMDPSLTLIGGVEVTKADEEVKKDWKVVGSKIQLKSLEELASEVLKEQPVAIRPESNDVNIFHQVRETSDALILFVCNVDLKEAASGRLVWNKGWENGTVECFDPLSGNISPFDGDRFELAPCNSLTLVVSKQSSKSVDVVADTKAFHIDPWSLADNLTAVKPLDDNVLVLDYVTVKLQDETLADEYFYRANGWFWNKKGYPMSPWDNGVQFKDELISKKFDDESGFELIYKFNKSDAQIDDLRFVVENPSMFTVYCNGKKVEQEPNVWKFDRSFGVFNISKEAQAGQNEMKLVAEKSTLFTELMPAWIVGSFSLESEEQGFTIVADKGLIASLKDFEKKNVLPRASSELERVSWLTSGVNFSNKDDRAPEVSFQFKEPVQIDAFRIWNYCEANLSKRGVKTFELKVYRSKEKRFDPDFGGVFELKQGDTYAQTLELPKSLKMNANDKITFVVKSNWNGIEYPLSADYVGTTKADSDSAFVGLAEVQFLTRNESNVLTQNAQIPAVSASSELVFRNHERRATFLVDNSGMDLSHIGWATQGRPFYAGSVDYVFNLDKDALAKEKSVLFELPTRSAWEGSVVAVLLNGKQIGAIGWQGETVELANAIQEELKDSGELTLTVRVYGTPKNLFGPFHVGKLRGSAWPGSFHDAPAKQPSGSAYDVIEYGLFSQ